MKNETNRYTVKVTKNGKSSLTVLDSYAKRKAAEERAKTWRLIGFTAEIIDNKKEA